MDPEHYLKQHHVMTYVEDAVGFLLERKDEDTKVKLYELLANYFKSIRDGTHVLFREYAFVSSTPHNRASFIKLLHQNYNHLASEGSLMSMTELLSLLRLLCHDFPTALIVKVAKVIFSHNALESLVSFRDFLYVFQVVFYYNNFLVECEEAWTNIASGSNQWHHHILPGATVVVPGVPNMASDVDTASSRPTSTLHPSLHAEGPGEGPSRGVVGVHLISKALVSMIDQRKESEPWESCPTSDVACDVLAKAGDPSGQLTFFDFVLALSRSDLICTEVGVLPPGSLSSVPPDSVPTT